MSGTQLHRGFLSGAVLLVLAGIGGGYLAWRNWGPLGDPASATPWELWRWLSERRLIEEPLPTRLALVGRLEAELRSGLEFPANMNSTDIGPFRENCRVLESDWFYDRCRRWSSLSADDATEYMRSQLDLLSRWLTAIPDSPAAPQSPTGLPENLAQKIERWLRDAPPPERETTVSAVRAGLLQWLCTTDLAKADSTDRLDLAERITAELDSKRDLSSRLGNLSAEERSRLRSNGWLLAQAWWTGQSRRFIEQPARDRDVFAARLVERLEQWDLSALRDDSSAAPVAEAGAPLEALVVELERWAEAATPEDAAAMRLLSSCVGKVLAVRALQRLWGR